MTPPFPTRRSSDLNQERFRKLVAPYIELDDETLDARLLQVERDNLPRFGYGVMAYTLSLIETAIDVTDGQIPGRDLQAVVEPGQVLPDHPVQLLDGVIEGGAAPTADHRALDREYGQE